MQAAPRPIAACVPFFSSNIPSRAKSRPARLTGVLPSTYKPEEALSATVSTKVIFQSVIAESTISRAGKT
ncbi:hypothetical protein D3C75_1332480 [compost metagenome]